MYKNQLQELAQRSCFNLPSYACIREGPDHAPRFKATVNFNGETFESPTFCSTLRQAEHAAAEVALHVLSRKGPSKTLAARVVDGTGVYKNLLQETAQRAGLSLPVYTTVRSGPSHFPVFTCTVELAGMSFTGELAKTKKQAQKSAAIAAWSALKKLSRTGSSPPSSCSTSSDSGGNSEMDHVTVARYLATLQLPRTKKLARKGQQFGQGSAAPWRAVIPYDGGGYNTSMYSLNLKNWEFSQLSQEVPMCSNWLQERTYQQQSHLLAIASAPALSPRPQIFPFIPYMFQDDHGQLFQAEEPKPVSFIPGIEPYFCFSNGSMRVQVRNVSHVTIKEIEENPPGEMEWLESDRSSDRWKTNLPPNVSRTSPTQASNSIVTLEGPCEHGLQNMLQNKGEDKSFNSVLTSLESVRLESAEVKQDDCSLTGFADGRFGTRERRTNDEAKYRLQNQNSSSSLHSNSRLQQVPSFKSSGSGRGLVPSASAPPVTFRSSGAVSTTSARQQIYNRPVMRSPAPAPSMCSRPWVNGVQHIGGLPPPKLMAPAVHIRSVVPVYSAPPPPPPPKAAPGPRQTESRGD